MHGSDDKEEIKEYIESNCKIRRIHQQYKRYYYQNNDIKEYHGKAGSEAQDKEEKSILIDMTQLKLPGYHDLVNTVLYKAEYKQERNEQGSKQPAHSGTEIYIESQTEQSYRRNNKRYKHCAQSLLPVIFDTCLEIIQDGYHILPSEIPVDLAEAGLERSDTYEARAYKSHYKEHYHKEIDLICRIFGCQLIAQCSIAVYSLLYPEGYEIIKLQSGAYSGDKIKSIEISD